MRKSCPDPDGTESSSLQLHASAESFSAWRRWLGGCDGGAGGTGSDGDSAAGGEPGGGVADGGPGGGVTGSDCDDGGGGGAPPAPSPSTSLNPGSDDFGSFGAPPELGWRAAPGAWLVDAMTSTMRS